MARRTVVSRRSDGSGNRRRPLGLLVALVMVASLVIPAGIANAAIGGSPPNTTTAGPDLRSAQVTNVAQDRVKVCFDQPVASFAPNANSFHLVGYNDIANAMGQSIGTDADPNCLQVDFTNTPRAVTQYTILNVDAGAVSNTSLSNQNLDSSVALTGISLGNGGLPGRTTGPDLVSAAKDSAVPNDVIYTHDEVLDPLSCSAGNFGFWRNDGTRQMGAVGCAITPDSTVARVSFLDTTNAVRFFELQNAVAEYDDDDGDQDYNTIGSTTGTLACALPQPANCTADLTSVSRINDTHVDYTFDLGPTALGAAECAAGNFYVFEEDTNPYAALACDVRSSSATSTVVRAEFPTTASFSSFETPSAGVHVGALTGVATNTDGALPLGTSREASGFTDGVDLESAQFDTSFFRVTYDFDENVAGILAPSFYIFDNNGSPTFPDGSYTNVTGDKVTLGFASGAVNTAVGAGVFSGGAVDYPGNQNPDATVGRGPAASAGTVQFSAATYSVNENAGTATITVTRSGGSAGPASVNYTTSNGTAGASDYTATAGTLNWADGDSASKSFSVPITNDLLAEGAENFNVALSGASGAALGSPSSATVTILDNDASGALAFSSSLYSVNEATSFATITVTRSGGTSGTVGVNYSMSSGSATSGVDFSPVSGTLTFGDGVASQSFNVPIVNDNLVEGNETANLLLSGASGGATLASPSTAVLTIVDDDSPVAGSLSFSSATHEVEEGAGSRTITVNRTGGSAGTVGVTYATSNGTATSGSDYTTTTGTLTFATGETTKTFSVPILNDSEDESNETFNLALSSPTGGATLSNPSAATVTIIDNDVPAPGNVSSDVSIRYKARNNRFVGRVTVPGVTDEIRNLCRNDREVVLKKLNGRTVGSSVTGSLGKWRVFKNNPKGGYYAVAKKTGPRPLSSGGHVICLRAESRVIFP
jgi:Calx-beta domain